MISSPTYQLAKFLSKTLKPLVGNTSSYVKDSTHFVKGIKDLHVEDNDLLISFDVVSLYTKVLVDDAIKVIQEITNDEKTNLV